MSGALSARQQHELEMASRAPNEMNKNAHGRDLSKLMREILYGFKLPAAGSGRAAAPQPRPSPVTIHR